MLRIVEAYRKHLSDLQAEQQIPAAARMSVTLLVPPAATPQIPSKSRGLAGTALLAGVCGVACALWSDQLLARLNRRRRESAAADFERAESRVPMAPAAR